VNAVKRVQLDLPEKSLARLQDLKAKTEATSYAEVIKNALRLYESVIAESEAGNTFVVHMPGGATKEYVLF
jgi:Arc/MetJ-type ribon-helix-helix transcriptional regulator